MRPVQMLGACHPDLQLQCRHSLTAGSPGQVERHVEVPMNVDHSDGDRLRVNDAQPWRTSDSGGSGQMRTRTVPFDSFVASSSAEALLAVSSQVPLALILTPNMPPSAASDKRVRSSPLTVSHTRTVLPTRTVALGSDASALALPVTVVSQRPSPLK